MLEERKILVIDDEVTICEVVADAFEDWPGTEVACAHDGIAGVNRLHLGKFNLAIIDVDLPGLSGLDVAHAAVNDNVPVLILSGHPDMATKMALVNLPYLEKPFRMADLLREAQITIASARENVARVKVALARLKDRAGALQTAMEESRRLLGESMEQLARAEGRAPT